MRTSAPRPPRSRRRRSGAAGALDASARAVPKSPELARAQTAGCALVVRWRGRTYEAIAVEVSPRRGRPVGRGVLPPCSDTGSADEAPEPVALAAIRGVPPRNAVTSPGWDDVVLVRRGLRTLPPEVEKLLRAPRCASAGRIRLAGPWLGILAADGRSETDLAPPYDLALRVRRTSKPRYRRAFLDVRVPKSLGRPLTREDLELSLWKGGTLEVTVRCGKGGRFVATKVEAHPPS